MGPQDRGGGADQSDKLEEILNEVASPKSGGRDLGPCILPPGIIELQTSCVIDNLVGQRLIGACNTDAPSGPRDWGMSWTSVAGTSLYWAGAASGTVLTIQEVRNFFLEYLDIYLGEDINANHAAIGIHWQHPSGPGPGENGCFHVAIISPAHGNIGMKFGDSSGTENVDTFKSLFQHFKNLATGVLVVHDQGLVWRFFGPSFHNVDVFFHFEHGGNFFLQSFHSADSGGEGREVLTVCKVTTGTTNAGQYRIDGGYIDRQGTGQHVVIFDFWEAENTCIGSVSGVSFRVLTGTATFDGTKPAVFEVGNRNVVHASGCHFPDQPVVRFRDVPQLDRAPLVQLDTCIVTTGRALGGELVTCHEGGCAGEVILNNCQRDHDLFSGTVGQLGGAGNANTHRDEYKDSNTTQIGTRGFDAWPSQDPTEFFDSMPDPDEGSRLGITYQPDAYWRLDDALGTTILKDISGNGRDIPLDDSMDLLDKDVQVADAPLPYLERCANWSNKVADTMDSPDIFGTGIDVDPEVDDLTIFGFAKINDFAAHQALFGIDPGSNPRLLFGSILQTMLPTQTLTIGSTGGGGSSVGSFRPGEWFHFVFTWDASAEWIKAFVNGVRKLNTMNTTFKNVDSGELVFGGNLAGGTRKYRGRFSRVGVLRGRYLSDKEATLLFLRSSTVLKRSFFRPT